MISTAGKLNKIRTLFLQCICLTYAVAFYSVYLQLPGLYGDKGILPARSVLDTSRLKTENLFKLVGESPTILWLVPMTGLSTSQCLDFICLLCTVLALIATLYPSLTTKLVMLILWAGYLSIYQIGQTFLWFQWDILLLEVGFLALIMAPLWWGYHDTPLPWDYISLYLIRWLLFRMMFASGVVKLTSGCHTWWGLTAMPTHYESQCIPSPLAWFAYRLLPTWMHSLSVAFTFVIEIPLAFFFFAPTSNLRKFTFVNQVILMVAIMLTGSYNFFNVIYIALCFSLADNSWLEPTVKKTPNPLISWLITIFNVSVYLALFVSIAAAFNLHITPDYTMGSKVHFTEKQFDKFLATSVPTSIYIGAGGLVMAVMLAVRDVWAMRRGVWRTTKDMMVVLLYVGVALGMFGISLPTFTAGLDRATYDRVPSVFKNYDRKLDNFQLTSSYGLFRRMTGVGGRPEVVLEASMNLHGPWKEYHFLYKPGNVSAAPLFCLPHQPRLDWQMWFAALGTYQHNPWLVSLAYRLLHGQQEVLDLLDKDKLPFGSKSPSYVRAQLYKYHFTESGTDWWYRELQGEYLPILAKNHKPLEDYLSSLGYINLKKESVSTGLLAQWLDTIRKLTGTYPPHIQIWTFAWLYLPLLCQFLI